MTYNSAYTGPQIDKAARLASIIFDDIDAMLADARDYTVHTAGNVFWTAAEGFRYEVAASDATNHHLTTAGSVNLYVLPGEDGSYNFGAFNPAADGTTDDYAKLMLAINAATWGSGIYTRGPTIRIPDATYAIAQTVELKRIVTLIGIFEGGVIHGGPTFKFPTNTRGITINRFNTLDGDEEVPTTTAADWTRIENLVLDGTSVSTDPSVRDVNACGIRMKAAALLRNVKVMNFAGDGYHIQASVAGEGGGGDTLGNCNLWRMEDCKGIANGRHGLHARGSDANGGTCIGGNFTYNGEFGIRDMSFLGNTYVGCHTATNGVGVAAGNTGNSGGNRGGSRVTFGGVYYRAKYKPITSGDNVTEQDSAQNAAYHSTQPGTDETVWETDPNQGGSANWYPLWVTGQPAGTYRLGGGYFMSNNNARTVVMGCYSESDEIGNLYNGNYIQVLGGIQEKVLFGQQLRTANGSDIYARTIEARDNLSSDLRAQLGGNAANGDVLKITHSGLGTFRLRYNGSGALRLDDVNSGSRVAFDVPGAGSTNQMGTSEAIRYLMHMPTFAVGGGSGARRQTNGTAAPTTGAWARGDIVWNRDAAAAGWAGWICVTAGTPGTWKQFGAIEA